MSNTVNDSFLPSQDSPVTFTFSDPIPGAPSSAVCTKVGKIALGQDGAIDKNTLFRLDTPGTGTVYSLKDNGIEEAGKLFLEKLDLLLVHSNSVFFGPYYAEENDEFPVLYTNVYNSYSSAPDRKEGTCAAYRILREGDHFQGKLTQVIRIGFTENRDLWKSLPGNEDVRSYGNFVSDNENRILWAFTMRDKEKVTRFFSFPMPHPYEGKTDPTLGCRILTLTESDITEQFDTEYSHYLQGAHANAGRIYSSEGFSDSETNPARMKVIDTRLKKTIAVLNFQENGLTEEAELVSEYQGGILYADWRGNLYRIVFHPPEFLAEPK